MRFLSLVAFILPPVAAATSAFAQTNQPNQQAQLRITVVDQTGAGLPGATVRVTSAGAPAEKYLAWPEGHALQAIG